MKSRKGSILSVLLVLITITSLVSGMIVLSGKADIFTRGIGNEQMNIIKLYYRGEKALFYIDQSARLTVPKAIMSLGNKGGFELVSDCGELYGYNKWNDGDIFCFPDARSSFGVHMMPLIDDYLKDYPDVNIPTENYDFAFLESGKLAGVAMKDLKFTNNKTTYTIKPSFAFETDYDIDIYKRLEAQSINLIESCSDAADLGTCITGMVSLMGTGNEKINKGGCGALASSQFAQDLTNYEDRTIRFCAEDTRIAGSAIKFALNFPDKVPPAKVVMTSVVDKPVAEQKIIVSWSANTEPDVKEYKIYYSIDEFDNVEDATLAAIVERVDGQTDYEADIGIPEELTTYYIAVTAIDFAGNEDKEVFVMEGMSIDDLKPGEHFDVSAEYDASDKTVSIIWFYPGTNEDGSPLIDLEGFEIIEQKIGGTEILLLTVDTSNLGRQTINVAAYEAGEYTWAIAAFDEVPNKGQPVWSSAIQIN